jgi:hypothetical protein
LAKPAPWNLILETSKTLFKDIQILAAKSSTQYSTSLQNPSDKSEIGNVWRLRKHTEIEIWKFKINCSLQSHHSSKSIT